MNKPTQSVHRNGPIQKRPKLDIQLSQSSPPVSYSKPLTPKSIIEDAWGNDYVGGFEALDSDVTLALSQAPIETKYYEVQGNIGLERRDVQKPESVIKKQTTSNVVKNIPKTPLRRTASSGWPATSTFSQSTQPICNMNSNNVKPLKKTSEELAEEIKILKEELTRKNGEVNLIRCRLQTVQKESDRQKKDYTDKIAAMKEESDRMAAQVAKEIKSLKGQLDVKTMEMETAERKIQPLSSVNRLIPKSPGSWHMVRPVARGSQRDYQLMCHHGHMRAKLHTQPLALLRQLLLPGLMVPTTLSKPSYSNAIPGQQTGSSCCTSSPSGTVLPHRPYHQFEPCPGVEPCAMFLLAPSLLDINSKNAHQVLTQVTETCLETMSTMLQQLTSSSLPPKSNLKSHSQSDDLSVRDAHSLLSHKELYNGEKGICARRVLALQSFLVEFSSYSAQLIAPSCKGGQDDEEMKHTKASGESKSTHMLLMVVKDVVRQIKVQKSAYSYTGVLAAVLVLLKSLLQADVSLSEHSQEVMLQVLQEIVSARPGSLCLNFSLQVLVAATRYPHFTESLCRNTDKCVLQVLCSMIQAYPTHNKYLLADLFTSWVLTLFYGRGVSSPTWLFTTPSQTVCMCRRLISRLCMGMLGDTCTLFTTAKSIEKSLMENLLKRGVQLIYTLLYQDEHFGLNVDSASEGNYELFINSMDSFLETQELKLDEATYENVATLNQQELELKESSFSEAGSLALLSNMTLILK